MRNKNVRRRVIKMEFPNLRNSAGWLASRFPGFYSEECYHILSDYFRWHSWEEKFESHENKSIDNLSKKRKIDNGPCSESLEPIREDSVVIEGELQQLDSYSELHTDGTSDGTTGQHSTTQPEQTDDESTGSPLRRDDVDG